MFRFNIFVSTICALVTILPAAAIPQSDSTTTSSAADSTSSSGSSGATFTNVRITFYNAGLGACGETNTDAEDILALTTEQWDNGAHCGETITITANGKTKDAVIKDRCMGCPYGGLDLTPTLFSYFADQGLGHIQGDWSFKSGGGSSASGSGSASGSDTAQSTSAAGSDTAQTTSAGSTDTAQTTSAAGTDTAQTTSAANTNTVPTTSAGGVPSSVSTPTITYWVPGIESSPTLPAGVTAT